MSCLNVRSVSLKLRRLYVRKEVCSIFLFLIFRRCVRAFLENSYEEFCKIYIFFFFKKKERRKRSRCDEYFEIKFIFLRYVWIRFFFLFLSQSFSRSTHRLLSGVNHMSSLFSFLSHRESFLGNFQNLSILPSDVIFLFVGSVYISVINSYIEYCRRSIGTSCLRFFNETNCILSLSMMVNIFELT